MKATLYPRQLKRGGGGGLAKPPNFPKIYNKNSFPSDNKNSFPSALLVNVRLKPTWALKQAHITMPCLFHGAKVIKESKELSRIKWQKGINED